jgi:CO/xanthine dehydrogenase FAD-binding subunit
LFIRLIKQDVGISDIYEEDGYIVVGAMARLANMQFHDLIMNYANGYLYDAISQIWSVQLRNIATVGGTVVPKWGFSDFITAVLALPSEVEFYKAGRIKLEDFLKNPTPKKDIMTKLLIKKENRKATFKFMRNSVYDFSIVNVAVSAKVDGEKLTDWRIAVGARPGVAALAENAMKILNESHDEESIEKAVNVMKEELKFGDDFRWSGEYRKEVAGALMKRAIGEVIG